MLGGHLGHIIKLLYLMGKYMFLGVEIMILGISRLMMYGARRMAFIGQKFLMLLPGMNAFGSLPWYIAVVFGSWRDGQIALLKIGRMCGIQKTEKSGKNTVPI